MKKLLIIATLVLGALPLARAQGIPATRAMSNSERQQYTQAAADRQTKSTFMRQFQADVAMTIPGTPNPLFHVQKTSKLQPNLPIVCLALSESDSRATVYYTLNGSKPTAQSLIYDGPMCVSRNTRVRAVALDADRDPSDMVSRKVR